MNNVLTHFVKGSTWKDHKYIRKEAEEEELRAEGVNL